MLSLALVVLATGFNTALAQPLIAHSMAGGTTMLFPATPFPVIIIPEHIDSSQVGVCDRIQLYMSIPSPPFVKAVAVYTDNPGQYAHMQTFGTDTVLNLVRRSQIEVYRHDSKEFIAYWRIPLVMPATTTNPPTPAVTIPPGFLVFQAKGDAYSGGQGIMTFPSGEVVQIVTPVQYDANVYLSCPGWNYRGPVAVTGHPFMWTDRTYTSTPPPP